MGKKGEGIKKYTLVVWNSHGDVEYSAGNGVAKEHRQDPWTWTTVWGMSEGVAGWVQRDKGGKIGTTVIA